jgi:hypothetical protein
MFHLETWHLPWFFSVPGSIIVYLVVRYVGWALNERRRVNQAMNRVVKKANTRNL